MVCVSVDFDLLHEPHSAVIILDEHRLHCTLGPTRLGPDPLDEAESPLPERRQMNLEKLFESSRVLSREIVASPGLLPPPPVCCPPPPDCFPPVCWPTRGGGGGGGGGGGTKKRPDDRPID